MKRTYIIFLLQSRWSLLSPVTYSSRKVVSERVCKVSRLINVLFYRPSYTSQKYCQKYKYTTATHSELGGISNRMFIVGK